ncbi:uncharacterized protein VTP21DRAFT_8470 [Calcarisporiella thermophila]|uniref:uncharacterized protein n=1 Tax=Calcarisporiella thermophila TaxID=911321 RepID=UPI003742CB20
MSLVVPTALGTALALRVPEIANKLGLPPSAFAYLRQFKPWMAPVVYMIYLLLKYPNYAIGSQPISGRKIPGPRGLPIIGNLWRALSSRDRSLDAIMENWRLYGPVMTFTFPFAPRIITINEVELVEHVLKTNFQNYVKGPRSHTILLPLLGEGIFNTNGEPWKIQRKTASHIFNVKVFRELVTGVFREESAEVAAILDKVADTGEDINLSDLFFRFTLDTFGLLSFGTSFQCLERPHDPVPFAVAFDYVQTQLDLRFSDSFYPIREFLTGARWKINNAVKLMDEFAYKIIEERRKIVSEGTSSHRKKDLLDLFLEYRSENGEGLSDKELRDVVLNFIIAGRDTTAQQLSWQYLIMMQRPDIQKKVREEIMKVGPDSINYDSLRTMHYSLSVFNESLRLYPPVPKNAKFAVEDDVLPNGIKVKAGELVAFSTYAMGRSEKIWGKDASEFNPERWLERDENQEITGVKKESTFKFSSFNAGPRLCLGQTFATLESLLLTSQLLSKYEFELSPRFIEQEKNAKEPLYGTSLTLPMRRPLWVRVRRLQSKN